MGLDMYLFKRKKNNECDDNRREVCYWRKANQIRQWFIDHTNLECDDNCKFIKLTKEDLEDLKSDCLYVLRHHNEADAVLPTSGGFFFGSVDYDEWYFDNLNYTVEMLDKVLKDTDFDTEIIEYYDWW